MSRESTRSRKSSTSSAVISTGLSCRVGMGLGDRVRTGGEDSDQQGQRPGGEVEAVLEVAELQTERVVQTDLEHAERGVEDAEDERQPGRHDRAGAQHQKQDAGRAPENV